MAHTHDGILFSHKRMKQCHCSRMGATRDGHTKGSQEGECRMLPPSHNLKYGANEHTSETQTVRSDFGCQGGGGDGSLDKAEANYYMQHGKSARPCCVARGTREKNSNNFISPDN